MAIDPEAAILATWQQNLDCWTMAVRQQQIESRRQVTDTAIVEAVLACPGESVLDLGCGEGWLTRSLTTHGKQVLGVDAVAGLVQRSQELGGGTFLQMDYEAVASSDLQRSFDLVVCNFSLFGKASVERLLGAIPKLLNPGGSLVIQTLHPRAVCGDLPYAEGWRQGSWDGFNEAFVDPAPWYFRTVESWVALLKRSGFKVVEQEASRYPQDGAVASLISIARSAA